MLSNWTSVRKSVLICVDRLLQCCASLECSSPPVSYSITKPHHWHNDVNVFTDSEVERKQALPAILIGKWFWELLKFENLEQKTIKCFNDTAANETFGGSSSGFFFFFFLNSLCHDESKNVSTFSVLPRRQVIYSVHVQPVE